jgi:hypothetical protein
MVDPFSDEPEYLDPDQRDRLMAGVGHNSGETPTESEVRALELDAAASVQPRQWATIERLDQLRKSTQAGSADDREAARRSLSEAVNTDLLRFLEGRVDGTLSGGDLDRRSIRWRRDAIGFAALIHAIRYVRDDPTRQIDGVLIDLIAWFCDCNDGTCDETSQTLAQILNRNRETVGDAMARLEAKGVFESFRGPKNSRRFRIRLIPAMARANALNVREVFGKVPVPSKIVVPMVGRRFGRNSVATTQSQQENSVATKPSQLGSISVATTQSQQDDLVATTPSQQARSVATTPSHSYPIYNQKEYPSKEVVAIQRPQDEGETGRGVDLFEIENEPARADLGKRRVIVTYPDRTKLTIGWRAIEVAAADAGWSHVPIERLLLEVEAIAAGWATPRSTRKSRDGTYRPSSLVTDLTAELAKSKGKLAVALAQGKAAEARAREATLMLPGPNGEPRRFTDGLQKQVVCNVPALTYGRLNSFLEAADKLRQGDPIATTNDALSIVGSVEKGEITSEDELARSIAARAARRLAGLPLEGRAASSWLRDRSSLAGKLRDAWPHVDAALIQAHVRFVDERPELTGVCRFDWIDTSEAEVSAVVLQTFGRLLDVVRPTVFADVDTWLEALPFGRGPIEMLMQKIGRCDAFRYERERGQFASALRSLLPSWRDQFGRVGDLEAQVQTELAAAISSAFGISIPGGAAAVIEPQIKLKPIQLVPVDEDGRRRRPTGIAA